MDIFKMSKIDFSKKLFGFLRNFIIIYYINKYKIYLFFLHIMPNALCSDVGTQHEIIWLLRQRWVDAMKPF